MRPRLPTTWRLIPTPRPQARRRSSDSSREIAAGIAPAPFEIVEARNNLLMTQGANDLWTGLSTAGLASPYNTTNAYLGVGDSTTAAVASQTDLQAAAGSSLGGGITAASNA